uniref:PDZ domain-containing protein n=1 Tax=Noctiluca scintillans TaxID=2966 RepID=A0A7S0ZYL0_NOCSC|mmetsp:Transcript_24529/g.64481  ORF Transcript_24529/g.64481 Transcript_24529/m.64481 type:complete len:190 (+) Transcript_24529:40-609(+)
MGNNSQCSGNIPDSDEFAIAQSGSSFRFCCMEESQGSLLADVNAEPLVKKLEAKRSKLDLPHSRLIHRGSPDRGDAASANEMLWRSGEDGVSRWCLRSDVDKAKVMVVLFQLPDGELKEVTFWERPLGLRYSMSSPPTILEVNPLGHAHDLGVESGWKVLKVGGELMDGKEARDVNEILCQMCSVLPLI